MQLPSRVYVRLVFLFLLAPAAAWADGMSFKGHDFSSLRPLEEGEQRAAIFHRDGREKMMIAVNLQLEDEESALWIFPVPATPEQVKLDVLDRFPNFHGDDPKQRGGEALGSLFVWVRATQLWPLLVDLPLSTMRMFVERKMVPEVVVHAEVEKWGVRALSITAASREALAAYLQQNNIGIPPDQLRSFAPYLSGQYALVVAWITSRQQLLKKFPDYRTHFAHTRSRWPCLSVDFPAERAYYPLRPTSAYGGALVRIHLYVEGYVELQNSDALKNHFRVSYYAEGPAQLASPSRFLYTTISTDAEASGEGGNGLSGVPARDLTEDLWLVPARPPPASGMPTQSAHQTCCFTSYLC